MLLLCNKLLLVAMSIHSLLLPELLLYLELRVLNGISVLLVIHYISPTALDAVACLRVVSLIHVLVVSWLIILLLLLLHDGLIHLLLLRLEVIITTTHVLKLTAWIIRQNLMLLLLILRIMILILMRVHIVVVVILIIFFLFRDCIILVKRLRVKSSETDYVLIQAFTHVVRRDIAHISTRLVKSLIFEEGLIITRVLLLLLLILDNKLLLLLMERALLTGVTATGSLSLKVVLILLSDRVIEGWVLLGSTLSALIEQLAHQFLLWGVMRMSLILLRYHYTWSVVCVLIKQVLLTSLVVLLRESVISTLSVLVLSLLSRESRVNWLILIKSTHLLSSLIIICLRIWVKLTVSLAPHSLWLILLWDTTPLSL